MFGQKNCQFQRPHLINQYIHFIDKADLVIDLHEGWGYYFIDKESVGSGIYCESTNQDLHNTIKNIIDKVNNTIDDPKKYFGSKQKQLIDNSLSDYCINKKINYIGIETTGQNDIQPMQIRLNQLDIIVPHLLNYYNII